MTSRSITLASSTFLRQAIRQSPLVQIFIFTLSMTTYRCRNSINKGSTSFFKKVCSLNRPFVEGLSSLILMINFMKRSAVLLRSNFENSSFETKPKTRNRDKKYKQFKQNGKLDEKLRLRFRYPFKSSVRRLLDRSLAKWCRHRLQFCTM